MSPLILLFPVAMYLGIALIATFVSLRYLGFRLKNAEGLKYVTDTWRKAYIDCAKEDLSTAWFWPFYVVRWLTMGVFGDFFKGIGAVLRGKP